MTIKSSENKEKWKLHINSQLSSGQTQIQWCEEQSVNIHSFRYWKNRLQIKPEQSKESTGFVAIKPVTLQKVSKMRIRIDWNMIFTQKSWVVVIAMSCSVLWGSAFPVIKTSYVEMEIASTNLAAIIVLQEWDFL
ncbi:hypothetical protein Amet_1776 [Alkaliphilus metalliredigens QYMF]|uniref:Transposase n=1 Tax=Alkaliphilus metalliredigens (strain QYMF) TaxID=293826 RepID=A6TP30_ALKMQ|nr:hypothetical protein Amet_1776 [Alkaliphilus metalliredigens QYMF]